MYIKSLTKHNIYSGTWLLTSTCPNICPYSYKSQKKQDEEKPHFRLLLYERNTQQRNNQSQPSQLCDLWTFGSILSSSTFARARACSLVIHNPPAATALVDLLSIISLSLFLHKKRASTTYLALNPGIISHHHHHRNITTPVLR